MQNIIKKMVIEYAKDMSVLVVDDDEITLQIYKEVYDNFFYVVDTASDGAQAFKLYHSGKKYDLIITDLMMPNIDGFELINKIRLTSPEQHIVVLTAIMDINEMRNIIELGLDGILGKPYNHDKMFQCLFRVLKVIHNEKVLKRQAIQLRLLAQDNIKAKTEIFVNKTQSKIQTKRYEDVTSSDIKQPKEKEIKQKIAKEKPIKQEEVKQKEANQKDNKYHTRASIHGESADEFNQNLNYSDIDKVEVFQDNIEKYKEIAEGLVYSNAQETKVELEEISQGLYELIDLLTHFGMFTVTAEATENLVRFISDLDVNLLENSDKKEMFICCLTSLLEDLNNWIEMVFVQKTTENINYFDASFANTCLELETIFSPVEITDEEESLDFF